MNAWNLLMNSMCNLNRIRDFYCITSKFICKNWQFFSKRPIFSEKLTVFSSKRQIFLKKDNFFEDVTSFFKKRHIFAYNKFLLIFKGYFDGWSWKSYSNHRVYSILDWYNTNVPWQYHRQWLGFHSDSNELMGFNVIEKQRTLEMSKGILVTFHVGADMRLMC